MCEPKGRGALKNLCSLEVTVKLQILYNMLGFFLNVYGSFSPQDLGILTL